MRTPKSGLVADSSDAPNELNETLEVDSGGTLYIELDRGAVEVTSHDAREVRIEARAIGWAAWSFEFDLLRSGNDVRLTGEAATWTMWPFGPRVLVRAWVPRAYSVDIRTRGGRIDLGNLSGRIIAETSGGAIQLEGAEGTVALHTSGGSIRVVQVEGDVRVDTSGGKIDVADVIGDVQANTSGGSIAIIRVTGQVSARTSGGSIQVREAGETVDATTSGGSLFASFVGPPAGSLETSGGSIDVQFPASAGANLDAQTRGGRVEVAPPLQVAGDTGSRHVVATINGGGAALRLHTSGGSIRVRAA
jgi:hypothetical protein